MDKEIADKIKAYTLRIDDTILSLHEIRDTLVGIGIHHPKEYDILKVFNCMRDLNSAIKGLNNAKTSLESLIK